MNNIKTALADVSAWMDARCDNRCSAALLAFALGFAINAMRMIWFP